MKTISFKSIPIKYKKEKSGRKPNTLREVDEKDTRFVSLRGWTVGKEILIEIVNSVTGDKFQRRISDVDFWKGWCIISWLNREDDE